MSKNSNQPIIKLGNILIAFLVIITSVVVYLWSSSSQNENKEDLEKDILSLEEDVEYYVKMQEEYTPSKVNENIASDSINIKEKFDKKKREIEKGVTQVYAETKTEADYEKLKESITPILGEQFANKLIELDKPVVNDSGKAVFPYDKLKDVQIAFGEYDVVDHTVELFVLVDYKSPKVGSNNPGVEREDRTAIITGKDFFILNYNLADDSLKLIEHQQEMNSEVKPDVSN